MKNNQIRCCQSCENSWNTCNESSRFDRNDTSKQEPKNMGFVQHIRQWDVRGCSSGKTVQLTHKQSLTGVGSILKGWKKWVFRQKLEQYRLYGYRKSLHVGWEGQKVYQTIFGHCISLERPFFFEQGLLQALGKFCNPRNGSIRFFCVVQPWPKWTWVMRPVLALYSQHLHAMLNRTLVEAGVDPTNVTSVFLPTLSYTFCKFLELVLCNVHK